jgi:hypothetical protein
VTCSLGHQPVELNWLIIWMRPSDSLERSWLHDGKVDTELEALQSLVALVCDLVLGSSDESSSLVASMSMTVELLKGRIDTAAANGFR